MTAIGTNTYGYSDFARDGFMVNPALMAQEDPTILEMPDAVTPTYLTADKEFQSAVDAETGAANAQGGGTGPAQETRTETREVEKPVTHTVAKGESLSKIGAKFGIAWKEIYEANKDIIDNPDLIRPGWELKIPGQTVTETVEVPVEAAPEAEAPAEEAAEAAEEAPAAETDNQDNADGGGPKKSYLTFEQRLELMPENQRPSMESIMYVMDNPQALQKAYTKHSERSKTFTMIAGDERYEQQQRIVAAQIARVAQAKMYNLEVFYKNVAWLIEGLNISEAAQPEA